MSSPSAALSLDHMKTTVLGKLTEELRTIHDPETLQSIKICADKVGVCYTEQLSYCRRLRTASRIQPGL